MKTVYLISFNGTGNAGGVERVTYYLKEILSEKFTVKILQKKGKFRFGKIGKILYALYLSLKLYFIPNKIVIANSWQCFLYPADYSIHHGTQAGSMLYCGKTLTSKITAVMEKISAKFARKILAVSENCKEELIKYYKIKEEKISVLNNFVDENRFFPIKHNTNCNSINVVFSGTLCKRKGLEKLIELANYLTIYNKDNKKPIKLIIATNNNNNSESFANNSNVELNIGLTIDNMNDFYNKGDILFFPTIYEGFSMSTLEALASGLPVIGTNFAIPVELRHYKFCNLIEDNINCKDLCDKICNVYSLYNGQKEEIHKIISKDFGKESYKDKLMKYFN